MTDVLFQGKILMGMYTNIGSYGASNISDFVVDSMW